MRLGQSRRPNGPISRLKGLRAYPNNPLYPQGKPDACVVGEKTFSTWKKARLARLACRRPDLFGLPPWPSRYIATRPHNEAVIRISSKQNVLSANSKANFCDLLFWWVCALVGLCPSIHFLYFNQGAAMIRTELIIGLIILVIGTIAIVLIAVR